MGDSSVRDPFAVLADLAATPRLSDDAKSQLREVERVLRSDPQARLRSAIVLDGAPYAGVSFGDADTADLVIFVVHGVDTDLTKFSTWAELAQRLCADVIRASVARGGSTRIAVIAWFGYDSGTHVTARATAHATLGAARLAVDLDAVTAQNPGADIAVIAYSYATTLFGELALLGGAGGVDAVFAVGGAGMTRFGAASVEELVAAGSLAAFATEARADTLARLGRLGAHPIDARDLDGAVVYGADGGPGGEATQGHGARTTTDEFGITRRGYFDPTAQAYLFLVEKLAEVAGD